MHCRSIDYATVFQRKTLADSIYKRPADSDRHRIVISRSHFHLYETDTPTMLKEGPRRFVRPDFSGPNILQSQEEFTSKTLCKSPAWTNIG